MDKDLFQSLDWNLFIKNHVCIEIILFLFNKMIHLHCLSYEECFQYCWNE